MKNKKELFHKLDCTQRGHDISIGLLEEYSCIISCEGAPFHSGDCSRAFFSTAKAAGKASAATTWPQEKTYRSDGVFAVTETKF